MNRPVAPLAGEAPAPAGAIVYAALDVGTNGCRLLVGTPSGSGFRMLEAVSRVTRLGEGLAATGRLSDGAISRTAAAVRELAERAARHRVNRIQGVATEACRRAANGREALELLSVTAGFPIAAITPVREAELILAGCRPLLAPAPDRALVFDIGGGSSELILAVPGVSQPEKMLSLPFGVVTLTDILEDEPAGFEALVLELSTHIAGFDPDGSLGARARAGQLQMIGTSGTVTTLAALHLDLPRYQRPLIDGLRMGLEEIRATTARLLAMSPAERRAHPCVGPERAALAIAGCAILEAVCRAFPAGQLVVADRGVRDGLLLDMIAADKR